MAISLDALRALVEREREAGLRATRLDALDEGAFAITFDDAHASVADAVALLGELDVPAALFVPTAYVGMHARFLDWDDLRLLRDAGWTIGSHGETHARLGQRIYDEDEAAHAARLDRELGRSRETLERELKIAVRDLAYPYGEADARVRHAAAKAGYTRAFVVGEGASGDVFAIPRVDPLVAAPRSEEPTGISVVVPAFERMGILSEVVTRLASQSYPEERYEVLVVDDGSTTDLRPIFAEMPDNVRLLRPKASDATFRAGQARQYGADRARFEILAFLDADVVVADDFLWHLDWIHQRTDRAAVLGYLSGYNLHDLGFIHTPVDVQGDLATLRLIPDRSREPALRACLDHVQWLEDPWTLCYTGNLSLPKSLLAEVGGFADAFHGWGLEDVDLGLRLHRAGATWRFARFAQAFHVVDPSEGTPRNPFRKVGPQIADFEGYLRNLALMEARHEADDELHAFAARARDDVAETAGRPGTVGIEHGGAARVRSKHHARLHALQPGGVPLHEKLDRVAYAAKVKAGSIYLLGGAPAEHDGFLELVAAAAEAAPWVSMQTLVYPFAHGGLATHAVEAGLRGAVCVVHALDRAAHERVWGDLDEYLAGLDALQSTNLELSARVVVSEETIEALPATLAALEARGLRIEEVSALSASLRERALRFVPDVEIV